MKRSGRSPLLARLRRAFAAARAQSGRPIRSQSGPTVSRRALLGAAAGGYLASSYAQPVRAATGGARIVVVGAGIAGLNATYLLARAGLQVTLFEAANQIGGRIQTSYSTVAPGVYNELGGEFIDTDHEDMRALAEHFGLGLIDTQAPGEENLRVAYYAHGRLRTEDEVIAAFGPLAAIVEDDWSQTSDDITFNSYSSFDAHLDHTNLGQYLRRNLHVDWLHEILEAAYVNEFGLNLEEQSSLNFVWTIGTDTSSGFEVYGSSDQRFKIQGGNHQVVAALAQNVADRIALGHRLEALDRRRNGEYVLTFQTARGPRQVKADYVVLSLPFSILRHVAMRVPLPAIKRKAIDELGYGMNAKLILGFRSRVWRGQGFGGDSYASLPYQSGWDSSRLQPSSFGTYTIYPGGSQALALQPGTAHQQAGRLFPGLGRVFPGIRTQWVGTAERAYWPGNPFIRASYAAYRPGQWTGIRGAEGFPVGNLYFAGEHTSLDWQGYMNGGAESGRQAAEALMARLG